MSSLIIDLKTRKIRNSGEVKFCLNGLTGLHTKSRRNQNHNYKNKFERAMETLETIFFSWGGERVGV